MDYFFSVIGVAFLIALVLYEFMQYMLAAHFVATTSSRIVINPLTGRVDVLKKPVRRSAGFTKEQIFVLYSRRSLVLHEINAQLYPDVKAEFHSLAYFGMGFLGFVLFTAAGLPALTALGVGVCGAAITFASKHGRDLLCFSDAMAQLDDDVKNARLLVAQSRRVAAAHR
ncbi:hypothetical protein [Aquincola sp. J276]|uniref:hypothetical protein n=1 Tax=Aquincola sp. J276 TaxID=2898432 RepID=UPI002150C4B6|nr:hypothetical protein [Aquincola sp. J276]MCR5865685.1 hypothetical protein [Aquincola sp. J276]